MDSVRKGLRAGELEKDTYDRLLCADCDEQLGTRDDAGNVGSRRICPECGTEWRQL